MIVALFAGNANAMHDAFTSQWLIEIIHRIDNLIKLYIWKSVVLTPTDKCVIQQGTSTYLSLCILLKHDLTASYVSINS